MLVDLRDWCCRVCFVIQKSSKLWSDYILNIELSRLRTKDGSENRRMIPELLAMPFLNKTAVCFNNGYPWVVILEI